MEYFAGLDISMMETHIAVKPRGLHGGLRRPARPRPDCTRHV
jgi:hypothetical protein